MKLAAQPKAQLPRLRLSLWVGTTLRNSIRPGWRPAASLFQLPASHRPLL